MIAFNSCRLLCVVLGLATAMSACTDVAVDPQTARETPIDFTTDTTGSHSAHICTDCRSVSSREFNPRNVELSIDCPEYDSAAREIDLEFGAQNLFQLEVADSQAVLRLRLLNEIPLDHRWITVDDGTRIDLKVLELVVPEAVVALDHPTEIPLRSNPDLGAGAAIGFSYAGSGDRIWQTTAGSLYSGPDGSRLTVRPINVRQEVFDATAYLVFPIVCSSGGGQTVRSVRMQIHLSMGY